jgi:hypothetical protein
MTWMKIDDGFGRHPKVLRIPRAIRKVIVGSWTLAGNWVAANLTDGAVPGFMLDELDIEPVEVDMFLKVGLWHAHGHDCDRCMNPEPGDYVFHDWLQWNRSKERVLADRAAATERQQRGRRRAAEQREAEDRASEEPDWDESERASEGDPDLSQRESRRDIRRESQRSSGGVTGVPTRPDPTRPDQEEQTSPAVGGPGGDASQQAAPPDAAEAKTSKSRADTGHRIPEDWTPSPGQRERLLKRFNRPNEWWLTQHEKFVNHFLAKSGKDARKTAWDRAFTNWIIEAVDREGSRPGIPRQAGPPRHDDRSAPENVAPPAFDPHAEALKRKGA